MTAPPIDLRSDTVTRPTAAMREAMARAEVGDDVYGEDPTVRRLEETMARLTGKEAALFVPSGTMGNQLAIMAQTRRGEEVVIGEEAHCTWYESGAAAALSGVQFQVAGRGGFFTAADLEAAIKPAAYYYPRTSLVTVENTHNRAGGRVFPQRDIEQIGQLAAARGPGLHLDGARLWNVAIATGRSLADLCGPVTTASICFSKGLGAPVGSALVGPAAVIREAHRLRKMLGAGMRQVGILAAGALHAIEHHQARIADDHAHARALGRRLAQARGAQVDEGSIETNIVNIGVPGIDAQAVADRAREAGVLLNPTGPHRLRATTHLDVSASRTAEAAERLAAVIEALAEGRP
jgi:threonine aldolase